MSVHSKIGASSYYRWKACPGSVRESEGIEQKESEYAKAGTIAHGLGEAMLRDYFYQEGKPNIPPNYASEELKAVQMYVEFIKKEVLAHECRLDKNHIQLEHRFQLASVHEGLYGTADCVYYSEKERVLYVCDYKHGAGIPVEVENNLQLQYYALGALLSTNLPCNEVEIVVIQPRCSHVEGNIRRWRFSSIDLLDFAAQLRRDALATEDPNAPLIPGEHCRFCPAAATKCAALKQKALTAAKEEFNPAQAIDSAKLKEALDILPALEAWIKNVREVAYQEACHGREPEGYKLVAKRATRKWVDEKKAAKELDLLLASNAIYNMKLKSPAQVEKLLGKGKKKILNDLVTSESSGYVLVTQDDKRPAVSLDARNDFTLIQGDL